MDDLNWPLIRLCQYLVKNNCMNIRWWVNEIIFAYSHRIFGISKELCLRQGFWFVFFWFRIFRQKYGIFLFFWGLISNSPQSQIDSFIILFCDLLYLSISTRLISANYLFYGIKLIPLLSLWGYIEKLYMWEIGKAFWE